LIPVGTVNVPDDVNVCELNVAEPGTRLPPALGAGNTE
jgi:hypothetical protein